MSKNERARQLTLLCGGEPTNAKAEQRPGFADGWMWPEIVSAFEKDWAFGRLSRGEAFDRLEARSLHLRPESWRWVMGANLAARRGAKANRRRAIVAQKRKMEAAEASWAAQAERAALLPIRHCLISEQLVDGGTGTLILVRGNAVGPVFFSAFLLDTFCRGVKDTVARVMEDRQVEAHIAVVDSLTPLVDTAPACARKLVRELVEWSGSIGFSPHRDYPALERLFGDVDPGRCGCDYEFGLNGKPLYINGPYDSPIVSRRVVRRLHDELGPDGFDYIIGSESHPF